MHASMISLSRHTGVKFQQAFGIMVAIGGALTLVARTFDIPELINFVPGTIAMKVSTALEFVLIGSAIVLLQMSGSCARRGARLCVMAVAGIVILTLCEYATGWNIGIDALLFQHTIPSPGEGGYRQLPSTGICIALTAAGVWLMSQPAGDTNRPMILVWLGSSVITIGLFTIIVHFVDARVVQDWWDVSRTSITTAWFFLLLGVALLISAWREAQIRWVISPRLTAVFTATLTLLILIAIYSNRSAMQLVKAAERVQTTHQVTGKIARLRSDLDESQSEKRGYIITGNETFLPLASDADFLVQTHLSELFNLIQTKSTQQQRLTSLATLVSEWQEFSDRTVVARRTLGFEAAAQLVSSGRGNALLDRIRKILNEMNEEQERQLSLRRSESGQITARTISLLPIGTALSLVLLAAGFIKLNATAAALMHSSEALRESEDRFRTMADAMPQLAWMAEPDGHIFWYNQRWYEFTGRTPEAMLGWGWKSVHDPEMLPRVMESWKRAIANKELFEMEFPLRGADGQSRWFLTRAVPLKDEAGKLLRWFGTNTDVSQKREAEEEIYKLNTRLEQRVQERTAELQAANASLSDFKAALDEHAIVSIMDTKGKITYVNAKFCAISGYSQEELVGQNDRFVDSMTHSEELIQDLWQTISGGHVWKGEFKKRSKTGSYYWEDSTIVPFFDASGKVNQFIVICTDITQRKLVEEALREGEERARLATAVAGVAVWAWDLKKGTLKWDALMFRLYGMDPRPDGYVSYEDWKARVFPDDLAKQVAVLEHTIATAGSSQREFRVVRESDHEVRIMQAAEIMLKEVNGPVARMLGINIDITERRRAEEEIHKLNADLQRRTDNLEQANKELEAFSYSVSHDLRAPLRAVDSFSKMALERFGGTLGEDGRRMLSIVRSETQRMGQLIDDLLAFCRLGRQAVEPVGVDMRAMAQAVFDELASLEPERTLQLNLHAIPPARGMPSMLRQVWVNLIGNAIKFTESRDVSQIEIDARKGEAGEQIYTITDNGVGFDMRHVDKLFGVFQRLHATDEFPGTGVGLAITKRILERHGGRIWAEAQIDKGATFSFALPNQ